MDASGDAEDRNISFWGWMSDLIVTSEDIMPCLLDQVQDKYLASPYLVHCGSVYPGEYDVRLEMGI